MDWYVEVEAIIKESRSESGFASKPAVLKPVVNTANTPPYVGTVERIFTSRCTSARPYRVDV